LVYAVVPVESIRVVEFRMSNPSIVTSLAAMTNPWDSPFTSITASFADPMTRVVPADGRASTPACGPRMVSDLLTVMPVDRVYSPRATSIVSPAVAAATAVWTVLNASVPNVRPVVSPGSPGANVTVSPALSPAGAVSVVIWNESSTYRVAGTARSSRVSQRSGERPVRRRFMVRTRGESGGGNGRRQEG
jgi:hypothetical protein